LQIHPSLLCNLACSHCYSRSGPSKMATLSFEHVRDVLADAAALGYHVLAVSGGEPMLWPGLAQALAHAKALGFTTTITTNGFYNNSRRLAPLLPYLDGMAISLDGPPALHNEIRGKPFAFARLTEGLPLLRDLDVPFGFIHTLTRRSWDALEWLAAFAEAEGARLLQLHPLEMVGRAADTLESDALSEDLRARAWLIAILLGRRHPSLFIQTDLITTEELIGNPALVHAGADLVESSPADQAGLLVLQEDGTVSPIAYGFNPRFQVTNIHARRLRDSWAEFAQQRLPALRSLARGVWSELVTDRTSAVFNWHERMLAASFAT
jgi:MoaA/NifB/PqqE/SkfB family radical SAM enzyme